MYVGRRHHHHHVKKKSIRSIHITFYVFHTIYIFLAISLFLTAYFVQVEEKNTMGDIELHVTQATAIIYNVCGGTIFAAVLTGLAGQFFRKSFLWFLYCVFVSVICLALLSAAGSSFGNMTSHDHVINSLKELMMDYGSSNKKESKEMTLAWDKLQQKYACCGVDNYTDWQNVDYGLTSLRVPPSCCLKTRWEHVKEVPENCGQNMLPDHDRANEYIFVNGCLAEIMKELNLQLFILGVVGMIVALFNIITLIFSCFLIITKRI